MQVGLGALPRSRCLDGSRQRRARGHKSQATIGHGARQTRHSPGLSLKGFVEQMKEGCGSAYTSASQGTAHLIRFTVGGSTCRIRRHLGARACRPVRLAKLQSSSIVNRGGMHLRQQVLAEPKDSRRWHVFRWELKADNPCEPCIVTS